MKKRSPKKYKSTIILLLLSCLIFSLSSSPALCQNTGSDIIQDINFYTDETKFNQDNLLILQVNLSGLLILEEPIIGYVYDKKSFFPAQNKQIFSSLKNLTKNDKQIFLSLKDFVRVLEFPITFQKHNMLANGWFINEKNTFSFDIKKSRCVLGKKKFNILQESVVIFKDDIFVDIETLKKWFGFDVSFNIGEQEIIVNSGGILPIEIKYEREQRWQKIESVQKNEIVNQEKEEPNELLQTPYKLASIPFADLSYAENYSKSKTASNSTSTLNTLFAGDFLYLNNQFFGTAQDKVLTGARLTSGRKDPSGKLLGIGATEFSLGDVYTPELALLARSGSGKGATISNYPLEYVNQFNKVTIRGDSQPNWDVEAYRNNSLINFQKVSNNGIYEFLDFPVVPGLNIVKLVFYGPSGQKREETRKFMVGDDLLQENKLYYRFAANKNNETLFVTPGQKFALKTTSSNKSDGVARLFGELGYGVTKNTSIVANFLRIPTDFSGIQNSYSALSLRSSLLGVSGRFDIARDLTNKFNAQEMALQTMFFSYNLSTIFDRYDKEFVSENNQSSTDPLYNQSTIRLDGPLEIPFLSLPSRISFTGIRQNYYSKEFRNDFEGEISFGLSSKVGLTQSIKHTADSKIEGDGNKIVNGRTLLSYQFSSKLLIRSTLSYDIQPAKKLSSSDVSGSYNFDNNLNFSLNASHQFAKNEQKSSNNYSSSISKVFDKFILSFGGNYSDANNGSYGINFNLSTSFGYDSKNNMGVISGISIANGGAVAARVFLDDNNNGVFDKNEKALEEIEVIIGGGKKVKTNKQGVAFIANIPTNNPSKIEVNSDSLPDPYLLVRKKAVKIVPHSGTITSIDFAVSQTGDISGYVFLDDEQNPTSNVEIELEDMVNKGKIYNVKSGYDGFYSLEMIPFGKYQLRVSPKQSARLGFNSKYKYNLELNKENQTISTINVFINYKSTPESIKYKIGVINKFKKTKSNTP